MTPGSLDEWLKHTLTKTKGQPAEPVIQEVGNWIEIRLFISSTFIDTQSERDVLVKRVIPSINRKMAPRYIRIVPVDLRWGILPEESKDYRTIQKTCLNQIDKCRLNIQQTPWFLGIMTNRYGWIQNEVMPSDGFENPELFTWIDEFAKSKRTRVSITSMECIHAVQNTPTINTSPTVFFYHRDIKEGPEKERIIEDNMRWVFDFDYKSPEEEIMEESKYQYCITEIADKYFSDKANLYNYLKDVPHVKWNEFECKYKVGGAKFTRKKEGAKSSGVGYTCNLEAFGNQVEADLLVAIDNNFARDSSIINDFQMETIQHENSIKLKASTFVGRTVLVERCVDFCRNPAGESAMILHGDPGCGKSGLLAAVTNFVVKSIRDNNNFVFIHVVDSCPGSNILEKMLQRLQYSLRDFRKRNGESNISANPPQAVSDLRKEHHSFMNETAAKHPDKLFLIIVDAVNQFHDSIKSWDMWWMPRKGTSPNVKFMISTLNKENGTFQNARKACPNAILIPIQEMSKENLEGIISATLSRYNKKLTTDEDDLLGNQMELLLSKNTSPLYLIACCEALRKFGIFHNVAEYIESFPNSITELFSFLLDEWSVEYGKVFVEDVAGLICVSKDGLLENEINDLLAYKEERDRGDKEFLYDSSFSRIYDSLASFLAAGGGGYLRFFHDQLKYTVKNKFLTEEFTLETHMWMFDFFYETIAPMLLEEPSVEPQAYYTHVLQQIVFHQLAATPQEITLTTLEKTLRNIYFVRERVLNEQQQSLIDEYEAAIQQCAFNPENAEISSALTQWMKFVQMYSSNILEFPQFCHNMAITQAPSSWVTRDTLKLETPPYHPGYPLVWQNIPQGEDTMVCKYTVGGVDLVASNAAGDITVIATQSSAVILDQSSGEVLHRLDTPSFSVDLSQNYETVFSGDKGSVSVWDVSTGTMTASSDQGVLNDAVVWIKRLDSFIACGTGHSRKAICWDDYSTMGEIALFKTDYTEILEMYKKWSVSEPCFDYCYLLSHECIFAAGKGVIKGFSMEGELKITLSGAGEVVYSISAHPTKPCILSGSNDHVIREWDVETESVVRTVTDTTSSGWYFGGNWSVCYDHSGELVLSTEPQSHSLRVYQFDNSLVDELKGHSDCINKIKLVPGSNQAVSCDRGENTLLFNLPDPQLGAGSADQTIDEQVFWTGFTSDGVNLITVSNDAIRIWDAKSVTLKSSVDYKGFYRSKGALSPCERYVFASGRMTVYRFQLDGLTPAGELQVLPDPDGSLSDFAISKDGTRLLGAECKNMNSNDSYGPVWDISDFGNANEILRYDMYKARMFACAIHPDNVRGAVSGHAGTHVFDMATKETLFQIPRGCFWVGFLINSNRIIYADDSSVFVCDLETREDVISLKGHVEQVTCVALVRNETQIYTSGEDGTIRLFDLNTEECIYTFFNHRAQQYLSVGASPCGEKIAAGNKNGMLYILQSGIYY